MDDLMTPPDSGPYQNGHHEKMGTHLSRLVEEGKKTVPQSFEPLVCKPREVEPWRVFKIMSEFVEGFDLLKKYALAATFFGSTRMTLDPRYYADASALAGKLAKKGFAIITGGSAGIMEAANKGAYEAGGASIGLNIRLETNQPMNRYMTEDLFFDHFFVRKVMLTFASEIYVYFPGGFGTMDEFFEILTLVQTKKIRKLPIVLYGREYWEPLLARFKDDLFDKYKAIDESDMELYHLVDSVDEAYDYITKNVTC